MAFVSPYLLFCDFVLLFHLYFQFMQFSDVATTAHVMRGIENAQIQRLRDFLAVLDVSADGWRQKIERYVVSEFAGEEPKRIATFSVGEELEDEVEEVVSDCLNEGNKRECLDAVTQFPETVNMEHSDKPLDDIGDDWKKGVDVCPGDVVRLLRRDKAKSRELESRFSQETAIAIRREFVSPKPRFNDFPFKNYDYKYVVNSCCENVIGYMPIPTGVAGPLRIKSNKSERTVFVPMATTEGALIASTNRGCSAILKAGGVFSAVHESKMTRAPVVKFPTLLEAMEFKNWVDDKENNAQIKTVFESTSRFVRLERVKVALNGNQAYVKFSAKTGDAMGMNMVSKACSAAIKSLREQFTRMEIVALSGNYCVDKKPSAINWIEGRGRSVAAECTIPSHVVHSVLKTTPKEMATAALAKLQNGSSMAACIGGNNAHAANIVAAIFIATGQDAAQVVSSSMCSTRMEETAEGHLYVSCTMPCMEVATVGGGTILRPQNECLQMLSCAGPCVENPGGNAEFLAEVIAATVLAGELSLMAALVTDQLVSSHMKLNRSQLQLYASTPLPSAPALPTIQLAAPAERHFTRIKRNSEQRASCII